LSVLNQSDEISSIQRFNKRLCTWARSVRRPECQIPVPKQGSIVVALKKKVTVVELSNGFKC
jgi:hypothetical protein